MRTALLALAAAAVLLLGAGAATAAAHSAGAQAGDDMHTRMTAQMGEQAPMHDSSGDVDAMHAEMRETMPADLVERCDGMHVQMHAGGDMPAAGHGAMDHQAHHRAE